MKLSLRKRFLFPTVILFVFCLGLSNYLSYMQTGKVFRNMTDKQMQQMVESIAVLIDAAIEDIKLDFVYWSEDATFVAVVQDFLGETVKDEANSLLKKIKTDFGYYEQIMVTNLNGDVIAGSTPDLVGKNIADAASFKESIKGEMFLSGVGRSQESGNPVFSIAFPLRMHDEATGIILGIVDLSYLDKRFISPVRIGETGHAFIVGSDGTVIASPVKSEILDKNAKKDNLTYQALKKDKNILDRSVKGKEIIIAYQKYPDLKWTVCVTTEKKEMFSPFMRIGYINLAITVVILLLSGIIMIPLVNSIVDPIKKVVIGLMKVGNQVIDVSTQVFSSSKSMADSSSEQTSFIKETSASLRQMSAMTLKNAKNANQADMIVRESNREMELASDAIKELATSIEEISTASNETRKIINTIDLIAFQTNLLALNAAVEAARVGELGAGFSVVALEVKNLAMRVADAAKNTTDIIGKTMEKIDDGLKTTVKTREVFAKMSTGAAQVGELVSEIAASSKDQSDGIDQINRAVSKIESIIHEHSENASASADISETMREQADIMKGFVDDLTQLVGGAGGRTGFKP